LDPAQGSGFRSARPTVLRPIPSGRWSTPVASTQSGRHRRICRRRSLRPELLAPTNLPSGICLTELGVSGQRRLSVGGAISHFRSRLLRKATGTCKAARGYAATVGLRRTNRRRRSHRPKRSAPAIVEIRSGKTFRDRRFEKHGVDRVTSHQMSRNSFLAAVYQGALKSRCHVFQICCNVRDEGKLRRKIFEAYFVLQSAFKMAEIQRDFLAPP
jgi:hypothetical protein